MKILVPGGKKQKICPICDCIFQYELSEIKHIEGFTFLSRGTDVIYCPFCGERLDEKTGIPVNRWGHFK